MRGALHRVDSDSAGAHDDDSLPGIHLSGVDRGAPTGSDAAAEQTQSVEWQVLVDFHSRESADRGVFTEGGQAAGLCDGLTVERHSVTRGFAGSAASHDGGAVVAEVRSEAHTSELQSLMRIS